MVQCDVSKRCSWPAGLHGLFAVGGSQKSACFLEAAPETLAVQCLVQYVQYHHSSALYAVATCARSVAVQQILCTQLAVKESCPGRSPKISLHQIAPNFAQCSQGCYSRQLCKTQTGLLTPKSSQECQILQHGQRPKTEFR